MRRPNFVEARSSRSASSCSVGAVVDSPGGIVRAVDDHHPGLRPDARLDRRQIQVERRLLERNGHRNAIGCQQRRPVAEPGRLAVQSLVAGIEHQTKGDRDGREGAGRQREVRRLEGKAKLLACGVGEEFLRGLLARLVGEPVLVMRRDLVAQRADDPVKRHLVRIAEGEVANAGRKAPLGIARGEVEVFHRGKGGICSSHPTRHKRHVIPLLNLKRCAVLQSRSPLFCRIFRQGQVAIVYR